MEKTLDGGDKSKLRQHAREQCSTLAFAPLIVVSFQFPQCSRRWLPQGLVRPWANFLQLSDNCRRHRRKSRHLRAFFRVPFSPVPMSNSTLVVAPTSAKAPSVASTQAKLVTGAASGFVACVTLQPADLLKTRLQEDARKRLAATTIPQDNAVHLEGRTARLLRVIQQVVQQDGVKGLWRGTAPTVVRNVPGVALYLTSVAEVRRAVGRGSVPLLSFLQRSSGGGGLTTTGDLVTGGVTRVAVGFVLAPVTVAKTRMESAHFGGGNNMAYRTVLGSLRDIYTTQGIRGLWQGFGPTAVRDAPYAGLYLAIYQHTKRFLASVATTAERHGTNLASVSHQTLAWQSAGAGVVAGTLATVFTHPFDCLKTRVQTTKVASANRPPSMICLAREMLRTEPGAFLDGIGLRCARKAASSAIAWCIFEVGSSAWAARSSSASLTSAPPAVQSS